MKVTSYWPAKKIAGQCLKKLVWSPGQEAIIRKLGADGEHVVRRVVEVHVVERVVELQASLVKSKKTQSAIHNDFQVQWILSWQRLHRQDTVLDHLHHPLLWMSSANLMTQRHSLQWSNIASTRECIQC